MNLFQKLALLGSNIFTGRNPGGISPEQNRAAVGQGLTAAGLRTILASQPGAGPGGAAPTALGAIAQGALAGQEAGGRSRATAARQNALSGADLTSAGGIAQILPAFLDDPDMFGELVKLQGQLASKPTQPDRVDLGDRIIFYDPNDPSKIIETMLKTPDATNVDNVIATQYENAIAGDEERARNIAAMLNAATNPTPAGDLALVFSFMKAMDPGSRVTSSEFATAQNAAGVPARFRRLWNNLLRGEVLDEEGRLDMFNTVREMGVSQRGFVTQHQNRLRRLGLLRGATEDALDIILRDPYAPLNDFLEGKDFAPAAPAAPFPDQIIPGQTINPATGQPVGARRRRGGN